MNTKDIKLNSPEDKIELSGFLGAEDEPKSVSCPIKTEVCDDFLNTIGEDNIKSEVGLFDYRDETTDSTGINNLKVENHSECMKFEEIDIKYEPVRDSFVLNGVDKENRNNATNGTGVFQCNVCDFRTAELKYLKKHSLTHKNYDQHKREICGYQTHSKIYRDKHFDRHKNGKANQKYKCGKCNFETFYIHSLKRHFLRHKLEDILTYKCYHCDYETTLKYNLVSHIQRHKGTFNTKVNLVSHMQPNKIGIVKTFHKKCPKCDYQTSVKSNLRRHILRHTNSYKLGNGIYKCYDCVFETKLKQSLKVHIFRRHRLKEDDDSKCRECNFIAMSKSDLQIHKLNNHKNVKPVRVYKCNDCTYQTIYKICMDRHMVCHKKPNEITTYQCFLCEYKVVRKDELKNHILRHSKKKTN